MTAVATREKSQVPALTPTPALAITADDIALPRLYIGQFMSQAVQEKLVDMGDIYSGTNAEDPDPEVLWKLSDKDTGKLGVLFHVLALRKGKSYNDGSGLQLFDFDDPSAPADAWVTYNYTLACPELDIDVPYKWTLTRTGRPAAQKVNTVLAKQIAAGPSYIHAFRATTAERSNTKGKYAIAQVAQVEATQDNIAVAEKLFLIVGSNAGSSSYEPTGSQPEI